MEHTHPHTRAQLRKEKIHARDALSPAERERLSHQIAQRVLSSPVFQQANTILLYRATRGEVGLDALESAAQAQGKRLAYPLCTSATEMCALLPHGADAWQKGYCGIWEPILARSTLISPEELDLVLCPCTAFDAECNRMGMGAGFYDRYLPQCTRGQAVAVAFEVQKAERIPVDPWDQPMSLVFTENAVYHRNANQAG